MYNAHEIVKRIKIQAINKDVSVVKMLVELGLNRNYLRDSLNAKNGMTLANFQAIAEYLQVSTDYLLSITDNPEIKK
jgi:transcriptional regulator with XRE-family HTH domain